MVPSVPNLDGLIALAGQDGVDIRPTLLRVLTDLYVQKRRHSEAEEHRYTELALSLLGGVDTATRTAVARKLAPYRQAPYPVMRRLARDVIEVAEPVLRQASCLREDDLLGVIKDFGDRHAAAIEARNIDNDATEPADAPGQTNEMPAGSDSRAFGDHQAVTPRRALPRYAPTRLGRTFLNAGAAERRALLAQIERDSLAVAPGALPITSQGAVGELETAALQRRPEAFAGTLERVLRISADTASRIVDDPGGEPVVVAAKALAVPADVLVRILLLLNPRVGHSVERVFSLADVHERLSVQAARTLVASWQSAHAHEMATMEYRPLHWDDERTRGRHELAPHLGRRAAAEQRVANSEAANSE